MSSQSTVVLKVRMSCQGCAGAVNRVLEKMEGVESFDINLKEQKVTVKGDVKPEDVLETVSKSGKKTEFWEDEEPTAKADEPQNKPSEAVITSTEPENKPSSETVISVTSAEPENIKPSETATSATSVVA